MPMLELTYPEGALEPEARASLVEELTATLMRWEGAPDTEFFRQATWAYVNEQLAASINRAGTPADPPVFRLAVTVPAGGLSERRKQGLVAEATQLILDAEGGDGDTQRVWVHIHEIPDGNGPPPARSSTSSSCARPPSKRATRHGKRGSPANAVPK